MSLFSNAIRRGTRAAQPAANTVIVGTLYFVTDEGIIERSTGAAWESYSGAGTGAASTLVGRRSGSAGALEAVSLDTDLVMSTGAVLSSVYNVKQAVTVLTDAQIKALNSTPIQILAAPGAGFINLPVMWSWCDNFAVNYNVSQIPSLTMTTFGIFSTLTTSWRTTTRKFAYEPFFGFGNQLSNFENKAISVLADVDNTLGDAANVVTVKFWYIKLPV